MRNTIFSCIGLLFLLSFISLVVCDEAKNSLGINVHVVCHTHDDVGWLKTVDQYFMGANNTIQHAGVQYILDSVMLALAENPTRKFVYVEQAFFQRWYRQQNAAKQAQVKAFVAAGQLDFINGGWCMHDEAATHYIDMVDQTTLGHRFLMDEFGFIPKIGWQIDPFGHSSTQAALLSAEVGFEGLFFGRIDYQDHYYRTMNKNMEFMWEASESLGSAASVFSGAFVSGNYGPPSGFCFDLFCDDAQPIQDDPRLEDVNVQRRVNEFVNQVTQLASVTLGNNIMLQMGSDFMYENANEWFKNLDKLLNYTNADGRINVFYSTPLNYTRAKLAENLALTVKYDDFFPYADGPHAYWTGYFTSRPALKRFVRYSSAQLQVARHFEVFSGGNGMQTEMLWRAISVAQHHDAVSGTSKQHVAYDYAKRLAIGLAQTQPFVNEMLAKFTTKAGGESLYFQNCILANISICEASQINENNILVIVLYNALAQTRTELVYIPVNSITQSIDNAQQQPIPFVTYNNNKNAATNSQSAPYTTTFEATVPPFGYQTYFLTPVASNKKNLQTMATNDNSVKNVLNNIKNKKGKVATDNNNNNDEPAIKNTIIKTGAGQANVMISNNYWSLTFSGETGLLIQAIDVAHAITYSLTQNFYYYQSFAAGGQQNSGAYIFRPETQSSQPVTNNPATLIVNNPVANFSSPPVVSITQQFTSWCSQTILLPMNSPLIEFEWTIGPVDISDHIGKEIITRYTVNEIASNSTFYTDSNGREFQRRVRNYRPTWVWDPTEPISGNYYPVNSAAFINSTNDLTMGIVVDRSQGVASLVDGQLEFMIHRRILNDDGRGVGEPINETLSCTSYDSPQGFQRIGPGLVITGKHFMVLGASSFATKLLRPVQSAVYQPFTAAIAPLESELTIESYITTHNLNNTVLTQDLPNNIDIITFQSLSNGNTLIRFSHTYGVGEDAVLSEPVTLDFATLFLPQYKVSNIVEMSLTNNQQKSDLKPTAHKWKTNPTRKTAHGQPINKSSLSGSQFTIYPMQIKTFQITFG